MYRYDEFDHALVRERAAEFREQVQRRLTGEISEDEFKALRLRNGVYLQLHAYMLRIAIPYGTLSAAQMRKLAHLARTYDKGYGHFTTRQNLQFHWPALKDIPAMLDELAEVEMHAIQTSGNCIRNVTADQYAGVAADEVADPRIVSEVIRQWSTLHPEFSYLPRKFKFAVTGAKQDRAAIGVHDIGLRVKRNSQGEIGYEVHVGGGLGRTPYVGHIIRDFVPDRHLLSYMTAIMRVYNMLGRRDNIFKARIKILVNQTGMAEFTRLVEEEWQHLKDTRHELPPEEMARIERYFAPPPYADLPDDPPAYAAARLSDPDFADWVNSNVVAHKVPGYAIANITLKARGATPGDASAAQMDAVADLCERYGFGEVRVTHEQNLTLPDVRQEDLYALWQELKAHELASANHGLVSDIICCPGLDYCGLANARSIPVAQNIQERFADLNRQHDIGPLKIKISGCINACGHHHVGHIGILGVDKKGQEFYQITVGGSGDENTALGEIVGRGFAYDQVTDAVERIVQTYLDERHDGEAFLETYRRIGAQPFKETLYAAA